MPARLIDDERGAVAAEFAFAVPLIVLLLVGGFDYGRYILLHQKVQRTTSTIADLVAREETDATTVGPVLDAAQHVMTSFDLDDRLIVIVTEIRGDNNDKPVITWQASDGHWLVDAPSSAIGEVGDEAAVPAGYATLPEGEILIAAETYYRPSGFFLPQFNDELVYHRSLYRPRWDFR